MATKKKRKLLTASDAGKKGGETTLKKLGREHYQKIARKRWEKLKTTKKVT